MAQHLCQWGDAVEVIEPNELKEMVEGYRRCDFFPVLPWTKWANGDWPVIPWPLLARNLTIGTLSSVPLCSSAAASPPGRIVVPLGAP